MTDNNTQTVSEMIRQTSQNSSVFWDDIANYIEQLEERILALESVLTNTDIDDHK